MTTECRISRAVVRQDEHDRLASQYADFIARGGKPQVLPGFGACKPLESEQGLRKRAQEVTEHRRLQRATAKAIK